MYEIGFTLAVRGYSEQPEQWLACVATAGVRGILDGIADDVRITLVDQLHEEEVTCN